MYPRQLSQAHLFIPLFSVLILLLLSINHVDAEGVLPIRQRHRAQALIAARKHYKRTFVNDTIDATTSSDGTSSSSLSSDLSTTSSLPGSFNDTGSSLPATGTATGVLGPPAFVGGTTTGDSDPSTSAAAVASSTSVSALTTSTLFGPIEDAESSGPGTVSVSSTSTVAASSATTSQSSTETSSAVSGSSAQTSAASVTATSQTTNAFAAVATDTNSVAASSTVDDTDSTTAAANSVGTDTSTVQSDTHTAVIPGTETGTSVQSATFSPTPTIAPTTVSNTDVQSTTGPPDQQFTSATTSGDTVVPTVTAGTTTTGGFPVTTSDNTLIPTTVGPTTGESSIPLVTDTSSPSGTTTQGTVIPTGEVTTSEGTATGTRTSAAFFATDTSDASTPTATASLFANGTTVNPDVIPTSSISTSSQTAWLPTALITQAPSTSTSSNLVTAADPTPTIQPTGAPSVPKIVTPADGIPENPPNSTLVRIGFLESLNYPFVVQHSVTVAQIFQVLPIAIAYGLQIPISLITTQSLQPYPLSQYTATVAMVWIPQDQYDTLRVSILAVNSRLYSQVDPTAEQLVKLIDPTIPLMADGSTTANSPGGASGTPNSQDNANTNSQGATDGSLDNIGTQNTGTTSSSTGKQVAIGMGAAVAAIGYAALMFFGAKRFRKQSVQNQNDRRVGHQRVSSVTGEPASPPFVAPGSYRSSRTSSNRNVRGANISAPLMTENSLLL